MFVYFFTQHDRLCLSFQGQTAYTDPTQSVCKMTAVFRVRRKPFHATVCLNQVT